ncbi:MAG: hypothetical protein KDN19_23345, partial [Verrucomicrobiae bacterium]|nr:hypothetical protein [Verrucomicrobiae bacterium]
MNRQPLFAPSAPGKIRQLAAAALIPLLLTSGAGFRKLGKDLKMTKDHAIIAIDLSNADQFSAPIYGVVLDTAPSSDNIISADVTDVPTIGVFGFYVEDGQD